MNEKILLTTICLLFSFCCYCCCRISSRESGREEREESRRNHEINGCPCNGRNVKSDDFCSYGKRKEDEQ